MIHIKLPLLLQRFIVEPMNFYIKFLVIKDLKNNMIEVEKASNYVFCQKMTQLLFVNFIQVSYN